MSKKFLRLKQIIGTKSCPGPIPVSRSSWYAGVRNGTFPKPIKLGPRTTVWDEAEIDALGNCTKKLNSDIIK